MRRKYLFLTVLACCLLYSCIDDIVDSNSIKNFETTALILSEAETRKDYLNSPDFPALKKASEIFSNLSGYIIIDVRSAENFNEGHIENAVNVSNNNLFDYVSTTNAGTKQFLIVSSTGQASAYYTSLFRLYGLKNVYSLY